MTWLGWPPLAALFVRREQIESSCRRKRWGEASPVWTEDKDPRRAAVLDRELVERLTGTVRPTFSATARFNLLLADPPLGMVFGLVRLACESIARIAPVGWNEAAGARAKELLPFSSSANRLPTMVPRLQFLLGALCWCVGVAVAAPPEVKVTATSPESAATLARQKPLYARIAYTSDQLLRFQATGYLNGRKNDVFALNPSPLYPAGSGEAVAWISGDPGARIDELRVTAYDDHWKPLRLVRVPIAVAWDEGGSGNPPADWARNLSDIQQKQVSGDFRRSAEKADEDKHAERIMMIIPASVVIYPVLQIAAFVWLRGKRRKWSALPLLFMVPAYGHAILALIADSNLWPIFVIFASPLALLFEAALLLFFLGLTFWGRWRGTEAAAE
jgi:hypothetical protein